MEVVGRKAAGSNGGLPIVRAKVLKKKELHNSSDEILQFCVGISDLYTNIAFNHLFEFSEKTQQSLPHGVCQTESGSLVSNVWTSW